MPEYCDLLKGLGFERIGEEFNPFDVTFKNNNRIVRIYIDDDGVRKILVAE